MLTCANLGFCYVGSHEDKNAWALRGVTLDFEAGMVSGIAGCSGSGKSTLLRCLAGLASPSSGSCFADGQASEAGAGSSAARAYRELVALVSQLPEEQLFARSVREDVAFGPRNLGLPESEVDKRVEWALEAVGIDPEKFAGRSPFALSGGEARRVAIADMLALRPRYLLLDEPTAGLDPREGRRLLMLLTQLAKDGMGIVLVSHDLDALSHVSQRVALLSHGSVVGWGETSKVLGNAELVRGAGLVPPVEAELAARLRSRGISVPEGTLTAGKIARALDCRGQTMGGGHDLR